MTVYLPPREIRPEWLGVLSYCQVIEEESDIQERISWRREAAAEKISAIQEELEKSEGADKERLENDLFQVKLELNRTEQRLQRQTQGGPKEATVVLPLSLAGRESRTLALRPDHVEALRSAITALTFSPGEGLLDEVEPLHVCDGGSSHLSIETHRSKLDLGRHSGGRGWAGGGDLVSVLVGIWRDFDGDSAYRSGSLRR